MFPQRTKYPERLFETMYRQDAARDDAQPKKKEMEGHQNLAAARMTAIHEQEFKKQKILKQRNEERKQQFKAAHAEEENAKKEHEK
ncbi:hypothetical protein PVAG01_03703 [Phlyctema vagabunda]|uniref:Uncharacterized protein n=1 Tax=Phlyctema vagabunda TaxID=108571 RepID=A0ABR4PM62_9HELO